MFLSEVTAVNKEQLAFTQATISCIVTGLADSLDSVGWLREGDYMPIISGQDDYIIDKGVLENNSQTTTLTVGRSQNNQDTTYTCVITSIKSIEGVVVNTAVVNLKVFSKYNRQL